MLKLSHKFFLQTFALLTLFFLLASIVSYYSVKNIVIKNDTALLFRELALISHDVVDRDFKQLAQIFKKLDGHILVINKRGEVIFSDAKEGEKNIFMRQEIQNAVRSGKGVDVRYSNIYKKDVLYVAKEVDDTIIRLSYPLTYGHFWVYSFWVWLFGVYILASLVALFLAAKNKEAIEENMQQIAHYFNAIANKEYARSFSVDFAKEFVDIKEHLGQLALKLKKSEAKKEKFTNKIKKISRQRNEIISAISHEFKNPVAIINGYAQTLLEDSHMPPIVRQRFIEKIYNASSKIANMIDRLALAMKFENNNLTPRLSQFDMCELASEVVEFLQQKYPKREIELHCQKSIVQADKAMIEIAMSNLIDNALKYSELPVRVWVKEGEFCVEDRGIGLRAQEVEKITKKFYRVRKSWDNSMGLGLYIVSYILKLHGSKLEIKSEYSKGSRFCFRLEEA
ncbi:sensor histidine kinase KdpD [Nitratiruptor sp. YY09-18]|uniref:sensor histidine kinase n=1 Tax=Nitratiruptor sp. YY09-18 TaxID=2724901 RepID=UPI0019167524|nr:HAMP domain-containing sensor histidine kinase [Nitratiruptor sp. YY09-18]BCD68838.1 hypothetical protein NitYY0918_C1757 [Nitratiruptor sp. YY09-18]